VAAALSVAAVGLAIVQYAALKETLPPPDALSYFEVADQIVRVGYRSALPVHWSPLYPLYSLGVRQLTGASIADELHVTAAADAALLVLLCVVAAVAFRSIGRLCWPQDSSSQRAWLAYACGLAIFCAFALLRVGLRMPDALVTSAAVALLWMWCRALAARLDWRWSFMAGLAGGIAFLARANLLHWSVAVAILACVVAPAVSVRRRGLALAAFVAGLSLVVAPQAWTLSSARGTFVIGESGRIALVEAVGAEYPGGTPAWPPRVADGTVRLFTDSRVLNYPGFYEPGREFEGAIVHHEWWRFPRALARNCGTCLFGFWSGSFALMWPMAWALWPIALVGVAPFRASFSAGDDPAGALAAPIGLFLTLAGAGGFAMHLLSSCIGYYMPPYLIALCAGAFVLAMRGPQIAIARRAAAVVSLGCVLLALLASVRHFRGAEREQRDRALAGVHGLAAAIAALPPGPDGPPRVAAIGPWLGEYGVRLGGGQLYADAPDTSIAGDRDRLRCAVDAFRNAGVSAVLIRRAELPRAAPGSWVAVAGSDWALLDVGRSGL
jgi:hypothetical protein